MSVFTRAPSLIVCRVGSASLAVIALAVQCAIGAWLLWWMQISIATWVFILDGVACVFLIPWVLWVLYEYFFDQCWRARRRGVLRGP